VPVAGETTTQRQTRSQAAAAAATPLPPAAGTSRDQAPAPPRSSFLGSLFGTAQASTEAAKPSPEGTDKAQTQSPPPKAATPAQGPSTSGAAAPKPFEVEENLDRQITGKGGTVLKTPGAPEKLNTFIFDKMPREVFVHGEEDIGSNPANKLKLQQKPGKTDPYSEIRSQILRYVNTTENAQEQLAIIWKQDAKTFLRFHQYTMPNRSKDGKAYIDNMKKKYNIPDEFFHDASPGNDTKFKDTISKTIRNDK
jgi:hypothetical protein